MPDSPTSSTFFRDEHLEFDHLKGSNTMYDYTKSLERSKFSRERNSGDNEIVVGGDEWTLLEDVFSPADTRSTLAHIDLLDFTEGETFLEIGSGIGMIAVKAALGGCRSVVATDINPAAVANTERNVRRFGVADRVTTVHSDLFDGLSPDLRFDTIYWHSNNVWAPPTLALQSVHELAYVDPGYAAHRRFLREARNFVSDRGRVLLALSSRAGRRELEDLAAQEGAKFVDVRSKTVDEPEGAVSYDLIEVVTASN
ncbi:50S ribosomal protein L11 methyltransferase [Antrihabitans spumae]|uniref:50S ribosomal protein L11 methyltransferase n=1 Tax=Antrihabitans spumae TaxID=3373370 RepID=A0ABW7JYQ7_9NOCA